MNYHLNQTSSTVTSLSGAIGSTATGSTVTGWTVVGATEIG